MDIRTMIMYSQGILIFRIFLKNTIRRRIEEGGTKEKVIFINPGSVGQPRNLNPMAQYAILDMETERVAFEKVKYNIEEEQKAIIGRWMIFIEKDWRLEYNEFYM